MDCLTLEQAYSDGYMVTIYLDEKTYLPYKTNSIAVQMGVEVEMESITTDYKKVDGIMTAHSMT